jgi:hypothetical protein
VQVVINLALHDDPRYSLADEAGCVRGLGMDYVHIPVPFNAPTEENLRTFISAMDAHKGKTILVHCAANYRVTAFVGLYRVLCEGWAADKAFEPMRTVWEPIRCGRNSSRTCCSGRQGEHVRQCTIRQT